VATLSYLLTDEKGELVMSRSPSQAGPQIGVGIDTARYGHHATFLGKDRQAAAKPLIVTESHDGYQRLKQRLDALHRKHQDLHFHVRIDAAGQYATNLERFLRKLDLPMTISIGEPKRNKDYHKAIFPKRKADATESHAMARFGLVEQPGETPNVPAEFYVLREVAARLQGQAKDSTRAINRMHNLLARVFPELATIVNDLSGAWVLQLLRKYPTPQRIAKAQLSSLTKISFLSEQKARKLQAAAEQTVGSLQGELTESLVRQCVEQVCQSLDAEKKLERLVLQAFQALPQSGHVQLESIPGIGTATAAVLVAKIISINRFATADTLVGYFGIFPEEDTSGIDRYGKPIPPGTMRMSRKGNDLVRHYLWNAARSAIGCNPAVRALYARLRARGTRGDVALGHCMRKLLHLVFAVWVRDKPFNKDHYPWERLSETSPALEEKELQKQGASVTQEAAGHKRDVLPKSKVVTAATANVVPDSVDVNQSDHDEETKALGGSVDYAYLREQITMEQVLRRLGYWDRLRGGDTERRGTCPLHASERDRGRSFSVNLSKNVYCCFHPECGQAGNVLDFWSAAQGLPLYEAALHLADTFQLQTQPEQRRGARNKKHKPR